MNSFFHGPRFYVLAATGVLLLLATLALTVWMQMGEPYYRQEKIVKYFESREDITFSCVDDTDEPYPLWIPSMISKRLPERRCLNIFLITSESNAALTGTELHQLSRLPFNRGIAFLGVSFPPSGINACLPKRPLLTISLVDTNIDDSMVEKLPMFPDVKMLDITHIEIGLPLSDHGIAMLIERCTNLKRLRLNSKGIPFGAETKAAIGRIRNMQTLKLDGIVGLTDDDFEFWKNLDKLKSLQLNNISSLTGKGLSSLPYLSSLTFLALGRSGVTDENLECLKKMTSLEHLWLNNTAITDAGLSHMKNLQKLQYLWIDCTNITDEGLEYLKELKSLKLLSLNKTNITDAGLDMLDSLPSLQSVSLVGTKTTKQWTKKP